MVSDTTDRVRARQLAPLSGLSPAERLRRALALSALVRDVAWAGARRAVGVDSPTLVRDRFLTQLYGAEMSDGLRALLSRL